MIQTVGQVVPLKLDVGKKDVLPIAAKYGIEPIPAVLLLDGNGKVVGTVPITFNPSQFAASVNKIVKSAAARKH